MPNHPAPSYSIKNVYNPVNSNISAACYGGKRSLGRERGKKSKKKKLPFHWKCWLGTDEGVSTRKISFDMISLIIENVAAIQASFLQINI